MFSELGYHTKQNDFAECLRKSILFWMIFKLTGFLTIDVDGNWQMTLKYIDKFIDPKIYCSAYSNIINKNSNCVLNRMLVLRNFEAGNGAKFKEIPGSG